VIDRTVGAEHVEGSCVCVLCQLENDSVSFGVIDEYIVTSIHGRMTSSRRRSWSSKRGQEFLHRAGALSSAPTMRDFDAANLLLDDDARTEQRQNAAASLPQTRRISEAHAAVARDDLVAQTDYDAITQLLRSAGGRCCGCCRTTTRRGASRRPEPDGFDRAGNCAP
jgi:hypothetical protein